MQGLWLTRLVTTALLATVATASAEAQSTQNPPPPQQTAPQAPPASPDVNKIREAVNTPPKVSVDQGTLKIYVEIIAKWPSFAEMSKGYDFKRGATAGGNPMTHAEFISMVTPKEMYSTAGIRPTEMLQSAIVNWLGHALIKKGWKELSEARTEREINEIRARINRELAALKGGK